MGNGYIIGILVLISTDTSFIKHTSIHDWSYLEGRVVLNISCQLWTCGRSDPYVACGRIPVKVVQAVSFPGIIDDYRKKYILNHSNVFNNEVDYHG
jgi:hypothetical protein